MAASTWVLGTLLLSTSYALVGIGGIVVLLGTLIVTRIVAAILGPHD